MIAVVWHFWIGVVLAAGAIFAMFALVAAYFFSVSRTRYEKKQR